MEVPKAVPPVATNVHFIGAIAISLLIAIARLFV
jgi:hypothetical protein